MASRTAVSIKLRTNVCRGVYTINGLTDIFGVRLGATIR